MESCDRHDDCIVVYTDHKGDDGKWIGCPVCRSLDDLRGGLNEAQEKIYGLEREVGELKDTLELK